MALAIKVRRVGGRPVVTLRGAVDDTFLQRAGAELLAAAGGSTAVVVDLDEVTLLSPEPLWALVEEMERLGTRVEVVCGLPTGRRLLERWGLTSHIPVHWSADDAVSPAAPPLGTPGALRTA